MVQDQVAKAIRGLSDSIEGISTDSPFSILTKKSAYVILPSDRIIFFDASAGPFSTYLPKASDFTGQTLWLYKTDTTFSAVTIVPKGSEKINGNATRKLSTIERVQLTSDGSNWWVLVHDYDKSEHSTTLPLTSTGGTQPVKGTVTRDDYRWSRHGDKAILNWQYKQSTASATPGTGDYLFGLPSGLVADTIKRASTSNGEGHVGAASAVRAGVAYDGYVHLHDSTTMVMLLGDATQATSTVGSLFALDHATQTYGFTAIVTISGWEG